MSNANINLAIDGNEANVVNRVGSNVYAYEIISALEKLTSHQNHISVTILLSQPPKADLPTPRAGWRYQVIGPKPLWTQLALPIHLYFSNYNVLFTPGHYAPRLSTVPYVSTVMDLAFLVHPEQFKPSDLIQLKNWTEYSVKRADKIVAISQSTKTDVAQQYQRSLDDIVVAYPASTLEMLPKVRGRKVLERLKLEPPYFLYVGTFQPRKNLVRLIEAFELVVENSQDRRGRFSDVKLVLAGKIGWLADEILERIATSRYKDRIITPGYITDHEKQMLYLSATAVVLVGLYEGFGIPALEAIQVGTVPVVSNTTSLPEVVGNAGILVDPLDTVSISAGLQKALNLSAKERGTYRKEARIQLKKFSWTHSAQIILDTLLEVAENRAK